MKWLLFERLAELGDATMIRMMMVAVLCAVMGCMGAPGHEGLPGQQGPSGPAGPTGPQGQPGLPANGSNGVVWVGANGALAGTGVHLQVVDANGRWWFISTETGGLDSERHLAGPSNPSTGAPMPIYYYASTDCSGPYYLAGPLPSPRVPFSYGGLSVYRVRSDTSQFGLVAPHSSRDQFTGACTQPTVIQPALLMAESDAPEVPGLSFPVQAATGPLHQELRP